MAVSGQCSVEDSAALTALLTEYCWRVDHGGDVAALFTDDGRIIAPEVGLDLHGHDAITRHFAKHPPGQVTIHAWSGLRIEDVTEESVRLTTVQSTTLRLAGEDALIRHQMQGETHDIVRRQAGGDWRFVERRLQVVFPFDIKLGPADRHSESREEGGLEDGALYYVKARNGEVSVARYFARHNLFFAVGDAIGYFPGDLVVGRRIPLDDAFDTLR